MTFLYTNISLGRILYNLFTILKSEGWGSQGIGFYTILTNFSTNYLVMCKVYTDVGAIK